MSARSRAPLRITHPINQNLLLSLKVLFFHAIGPSMPDISVLCFTCGALLFAYDKFAYDKFLRCFYFFVCCRALFD